MEYEAIDQDYRDEGSADGEGVDDSGMGAAIAFAVALLAFVLAVAVVILRHLLFNT